jgi:signal transduction histidine kinase
MDSSEEDKIALLRGATKRINDIANSLLNRSRKIDTQEISQDVPSPASHQISGLLRQIVNEKREQYRSMSAVTIESHFSSQATGASIHVPESDFSRVISNLVNNAVEAFSEQQGKVTVRAFNEGSELVISVEDNGRGIPASVLPRLTERGFSHGKQSGSGLGLNHARRSVEAWGGRLSIVSAERVGTQVSLRLPYQTHA